jgi:xanthine dehydrogenase accessory factor
MPNADNAAILGEVFGAQTGGPPVLVATVIAGPADAIGAKLLLREDGSSLGSTGEAAVDGAVCDAAREAFRKRGVGSLLIRPDGTPLKRDEEGVYRLMLEVFERPARLVIAGGGHIGKALSAVASLCGFRVTVVDDRPEYASAERFPEADQVLRGRFDEVLSGMPVDGSTYVVCVTRGHRHDEVSLRVTVGRGAAYVGMIGSRRRVKAVLQHLVEAGIDPEDAAAVHTPIGLDIGAQTPEEIAVSIMAEIIQVRRGGSGAPLKGASRRVSGMKGPQAER